MSGADITEMSSEMWYMCIVYVYQCGFERGSAEWDAGDDVVKQYFPYSTIFFPLLLFQFLFVHDPAGDTLILNANTTMMKAIRQSVKRPIFGAFSIMLLITISFIMSGSFFFAVMPFFSV